MAHQEGLTMIEIVNRERILFLHDPHPLSLRIALVANDQVLTSLRTKRNRKGPFNLYFLVIPPNIKPFYPLTFFVEKGKLMAHRNDL